MVTWDVDRDVSTATASLNNRINVNHNIDKFWLKFVTDLGKQMGYFKNDEKDMNLHS